MEIPPAFERNDVLIIEVEMPPEGTGIVRESGAMIACEWIPGLYTQSQRKQDRFRVLKLIGKMLELQQALDAGI